MLLASYILLVSLTASGLAASDPSDQEEAARPVQVEFDAPAGCSSAGAFFSSLSSRTDQVRRSDGTEPYTTIQVRLTRNRGRVLGELRVVDDRGGTDTRKVQGASCDDVVEALSLTAALAVDPNALLSAPATAPVATSTTTPAADTNGPPAMSNPPSPPELPEADVPEADDDLDARDARATLHVPWFELGAGAVGTALLKSSVAPGIVFSSRWTPAGSGVWRATLGLAFAHARNDLLRSPGAVRVGFTGLAATACPLRLGAGAFTVQPCALMMVGWFAASGREDTYTYDVDHLWLSAGGVVHASAFLGGGLSLDLDGGISAPFLKRRFYSTSPGNIVGETPSISPVISLGLSYGF